MTCLFGSRLLACVAGLVLLGGCTSLLGGGKADDLFRFGIVERPAAAGAPGPVARRTLLFLPPRFAPEIEDDRILTTRGEAALYIKDARWVASVPELFARALERQMEARAPGIRLAGVRNAAGAAQALQVGIDRFEARYDAQGDPKAAPVILVAGEATLIRLDTRQPVATQRFSVEEPAPANSKSGIVAAFDRASARYTAQVADWTAQAAAK